MNPRGSLRLGSIFEPGVVGLHGSVVHTPSTSLSSSSPLGKQRGERHAEERVKGIPNEELYQYAEQKFGKLIPANMRDGGADGMLYSPTGTGVQSISDDHSVALNAFRFPLMTTDVTEKVEVMSAVCRAILIPAPTTRHFATSEQTREFLLDAAYKFLNENSDDVESALKRTIQKTREEAAQPKEYHLTFLGTRKECLEDRPGLTLPDFNDSQQNFSDWVRSEQDLITAALPLVEMMPDRRPSMNSSAVNSTAVTTHRRASATVTIDESTATRRYSPGMDIQLNFFGSSGVPFEHFYKVSAGGIASKSTTMWGRSEDFRPYGPHRCTGLHTAGSSLNEATAITISLVRRSLVEKGGCCGFFSKIEHDTKIISSFEIKLKDVCTGESWALRRDYEIPECGGKVSIEAIVDPDGNPVVVTAPDVAVCKTAAQAKDDPETSQETETEKDGEPTPLLTAGYPQHRDDASSDMSSSVSQNNEEATPVPVEDTWGVDHVKQICTLMEMITDTGEIAEQILHIYAEHYGVHGGIVDLLIAQQMLEAGMPEDDDKVSLELVKVIEARLAIPKVLAEEQQLAGEIMKKLRNALKARSKELLADAMKRTGNKPKEQLKELKEITKHIQNLVQMAAKATGAKSKPPKILYEKWLREGVKSRVDTFIDKIVRTGVVERRQSMSTEMQLGLSGSMQMPAPNHTPLIPEALESEIKKILSSPAGQTSEGTLLLCRHAYEEGQRVFNTEADFFTASTIQPQDFYSGMDYLKVVQSAILNDAAELGISAIEMAAKTEVRSNVTHAFVHALCRYLEALSGEPGTPVTPPFENPYDSVAYNLTHSTPTDQFPLSATFSPYYKAWVADICGECAEGVATQGVQSVLQSLVEVADDALLWNDFWTEGGDRDEVWDAVVANFTSAVLKVGGEVRGQNSLISASELHGCYAEFIKVLDGFKYNGLIDVSAEEFKSAGKEVDEVLETCAGVVLGEDFQAVLAGIARKLAPTTSSVQEQKIFGKFRKEKSEERQPSEETISTFTQAVEGLLTSLECEAAGPLTADINLLACRSVLSSLLLVVGRPAAGCQGAPALLLPRDAVCLKGEGLLEAVAAFFESRGVKEVHAEMQPYDTLFRLLEYCQPHEVKDQLEEYVVSVFASLSRLTQRASLPQALEELATATRRRAYRDPTDGVRRESS